MKVYYGPTTDTVTGATLLFEFGQDDAAFFDADGNAITTPPLTMPTGNYIIVENVDDSRVGTNDIQVLDLASNVTYGVSIERGT